MADDRLPPSETMADVVVVVTGGTRGIGRAVTGAFATRGATVVATYLSNDEAAAATVEEFSDCRGDVSVRPFDVRDHDAVADAFEAITADHGEVTVLVNNAGLTHGSLLVRTDSVDWTKIIQTNLVGTFNCTKHAVRSMIRGDGGRIVNVSSIAGERSWVGQTAYAASKAGIDGFTRAAARELGPFGIRVNGVAPGLTDTELYQSATESGRGDSDDEDVPLERLADPAEIAECIAFLASPRASYVTGEVVRVDGGLLA